MNLRIILYSEPVQYVENHFSNGYKYKGILKFVYKIKLKIVLTTSGFAWIKDSRKEILNSSNYKKATAGHQELV